jgi:hypothetical protein
LCLKIHVPFTICICIISSLDFESSRQRTKSIAGSHFMQRTFVGVDSFRIFQEVYLRTDDPRVVNVVKFSESVGDLKVEVISVLISPEFQLTWGFMDLHLSYSVLHLFVLPASLILPFHLLLCFMSNYAF